MSDREMPRVEHGGLRYAQRNVIAPYSGFEVHQFPVTAYYSELTG